MSLTLVFGQEQVTLSIDPLGLTLGHMGLNNVQTSSQFSFGPSPAQLLEPTVLIFNMTAPVRPIILYRAIMITKKSLFLFNINLIFETTTNIIFKKQQYVP